MAMSNTAGRSSGVGLHQVGQLLRQRFNAHETNDQSPHRIIFVVEFDDAQMIHAFEHQLLHRLIARRPQSIANRRASRQTR